MAALASAEKVCIDPKPSLLEKSRLGSRGDHLRGTFFSCFLDEKLEEA